MQLNLNWFHKNYLIAGVNLLVMTSLAAFVGLLLILQIKAFELQVSSNFGWQFFFHDLFATKLIFLMVVTILIQAASAFVIFSSLYSYQIEINLVVFSLSSIIWLVLYVAVDFAMSTPQIFPMVILLMSLLILLGHQLRRLRTKVLLALITIMVVNLSLLGNLFDAKLSQKVLEPLLDQQAQ